MIFSFVDARAARRQDSIVRAAPLLFFFAVAGCGAAEHPRATPYETTAYANPFSAGAVAPAPPPDSPSPPPMPSNPRAPVFAIESSSIVVTTAHELDAATEDIGPVQEIVWGGMQAEAMSALRQRARAIGADAVVGLELDVDPATRLVRMTGTAVRYVRRP